MDVVEGLQLELKLFEAGRRLELPPTSKNELLEALEKVETYLLMVNQSPSVSMLNAMFPAMVALTMPYFMEHPDKDVTLLVINCLSKIIKITAPDEPYPDRLMEEVLKLIVGSFQELGKMNSPSFERRFAILKTVAEVRLCIIMVDLQLNDIILEMFKHFFSAVSQNLYNADVYDSMKTIMCLVLDESDDILEELLSVLLINLRREKKDSSPAAHSLSLKVVTSCGEKLRPYLREKLSFNQAIICNCRYGYHEIVNDICRHGSPEINANQYTVAHPEVILLTGSYPGEEDASSVYTSNSQALRSQSYPDYHHNESIRDERKNYRKKNKADQMLETLFSHIPESLCEPTEGRPTKRSRVREEPMSIAHDIGIVSAETGSNAVSLTEFTSSESSEIVESSTSLKHNRPLRNSARKKTVSALKSIGGRSGENEKMVGRKIKVWWPSDKQYYEGIVESYDPESLD